jgi:hypothetical protein
MHSRPFVEVVERLHIISVQRNELSTRLSVLMPSVLCASYRNIRFDAFFALTPRKHYSAALNSPAEYDMCRGGTKLLRYAGYGGFFEEKCLRLAYKGIL